jgi:hypothetical protein
MGVRLLSGQTVEGSLAATGVIDAANEIIGPVVIPGQSGDATILSWSWSQTGGPSKITLERSLDGGTTWASYIKSDGSLNGETLYGEGDLVAKSGFMYRLKVLPADFVAGTVVTGRFS